MTPRLPLARAARLRTLLEVVISMYYLKLLCVTLPPVSLPCPNTARSRCRWSVSGGRACGTVCVYHEPVDGASERLAGASDCSAARFSAAVADQNVLQPVVWQQAHGHAQLAAGVIETELAAGEGVLGLARANRPRRHVAARRGVTNMMLLQHSFIWWLSQWDGAAALPS